MAISLVYSTFGTTFSKEVLSQTQNGGHFENAKISNIASIVLFHNDFPLEVNSPNNIY